MHRLSLIRSAALVAVAAALAAGAAPNAGAQSRSSRDDRAQFRVDTTVSVGRDASIDLGLISGDIIVTASSRDEVRIHAYSEYIPLRFEHVGNSVRLGIVSGQYRRSGDQRIEISVPMGARVTAASVSGNVEIRGVRGEVEASAVSGDVSVEGVTRRANLHTVSGSLRGRDINGDVRARTVSGDLRVEGVVGEIDAESTSGEIEILDARSSHVHAESISGEITYDGTIARDGRYDFSAHSGDVRLTIPKDAGISLNVSSFSGSVSSSLVATLTPDRNDDGRRGPRRHRMELSINGGGARVTAETFSGDIVINGAGTSRRDNRDNDKE
jgi:hypothetical protein